MESGDSAVAPAEGRRFRFDPAKLHDGPIADAIVIAALVGLFLFAHRFLDGLDVGGDAVTKWQFVRQWHYGNDFSHVRWNHHMTRMGVNVITWIVQTLFGTNWRYYYFGPVFMVALQLPFAFLLAKRFGGRLAGIAACLAITFLPSVQLQVSQLLPDGFVGTYAVIGTYLIVRLAEAGARRRLPLLLAISFVAFFGYLAKETFFFFYPGFVVAVWLTRRRLVDAFVFMGALLVQLGLETACYRLFTEYSSRLAVVRSTHFAGAGEDDGPPVLSVSGFIGMIDSLDRAWHYLLIAAAAGALWLLLTRAAEKGRAWPVVLVGGSHVLFLGISSQRWQRALPRYMDPALPFAAIGAGIALAVAVTLVLGQVGRLPPLRSVVPAVRRLIASSRVALAASLLATALVAFVTYRHQVEHPILDGYEHGARMARLANNAYERNLPIVHGTRAGKVLLAFYNVYLHDSKLARDGILPDFEQARRRAGGASYLVRDPSVYSGKMLEAMREAGCALELRRGPKNRGMKGCADIARHDELPARCDRLLRDLSRRGNGPGQ